MSNSKWTISEKAVLKRLVDVALRRANDDALKAYRAFNVESVDRLWKLEQEIRAWRKDREDIYLKYEDMEVRLARWLRRGWLKPSELSGLDEDRLGGIQRKA
jgi:hypothetical protein